MKPTQRATFLKIHQLLPKNVSFITVHQSKTKLSYYCLFFKKPYYFKVVRVSNHLPSRRLDIPSFLWNNNQRLSSQILQFLQDESAWFRIHYHDFIVLHYVVHRKEQHLEFYVDDLFRKNTTHDCSVPPYINEKMCAISLSDMFVSSLKKVTEEEF